MTKVSDLKSVQDLIKSYPDFPKKGILFRDIFPIFLDPSALKFLLDRMVKEIRSKLPDCGAIVGLDARGFLIGPSIAMELGVPFIPVRKQGKLPGTCATVEYLKEYGADYFEMQEESMQSVKGSVCVVDDLLATGGSAKAAEKLLEVCGAKVGLYAFVVELVDLNGMKQLNAPVYSVFKY